MKKPLLLLRKAGSEWLLWLLLLLFLLCWLRLLYLDSRDTSAMTEDVSYTPQSFIDTLRKAMED